MIETPNPFLKLQIGKLTLRKFPKVVLQRMPYRIGKRRLFPPQNGLRDQRIVFKRLAEQVFSLPIAIHFSLRIDRHTIVYKIKIPKRNPGLQRMDADTPIRAQHIVHMNFPDPFFSFPLKFLRIRRKIGIFIAKNFIGNLPRQDHPDIRLFVNDLAHQIHADRGPDRGNIVGA